MDKKHIVLTVVSVALIAPIIVLAVIFWDNVIRVIYNIFLGIIGIIILCTILRHLCIRASTDK